MAGANQAALVNYENKGWNISKEYFKWGLNLLLLKIIINNIKNKLPFICRM